MRRIQRDDAFDEAFRDLYPRVVRSVQRLLGDKAAAEDVASETLARTFAEWERVRHLSHRDAWVLRVALNLALDGLRRRMPLPRPAVDVDAEEVATLRVALWAALRALPKRQREAVVLRYIAGLTDEEIARSLEISPLTVKTHMARGLAALRKRLGVVDEEVLRGI